MGYTSHRAIIVTSSNRSKLHEAHDVAMDIFGSSVCGPLPEVTNGYSSFFVGPDGSNEGWEESNAGDRLRTRFIKWLRSQYHSDGSSSLAWVEVQYGDDEKKTRVCRSSDRDYLKRNEAKA